MALYFCAPPFSGDAVCFIFLALCSPSCATPAPSSHTEPDQLARGTSLRHVRVSVRAKGAESPPRDTEILLKLLKRHRRLTHFWAPDLKLGKCIW
jgi:hypothetical protein